MKGKTTTIAPFSSQGRFSDVKSVRVLGQDEPSHSERAQEELLLKSTRGEVNIETSLFVRLLWFPTADDIALQGVSDDTIPPGVTISSHLNESQKHVARGMISKRPVIITQGEDKSTSVPSVAYNCYFQS